MEKNGSGAEPAPEIPKNCFTSSGNESCCFFFLFMATLGNVGRPTRDFLPPLPSKNWTKWGDILGTWSASAHYKDDFTGVIDMSVFAVAHVTCDTFGNYRRPCDKVCDAMNDNEACVESYSNINEHHYWPPKYKFECKDIGDENTQVWGGDANYFCEY